MVAPVVKEVHDELKALQDLIKVHLISNRKKRHQEIIQKQMTIIAFFVAGFLGAKLYGWIVPLVMLVVLILFVSYLIREDDEKSNKG